MMFREQVLNKNAENLCKASAENLFYAEPPPNLAQNLKNFAEIAQLVEHDLAKVGVASSRLVFRTREVFRNGDLVECISMGCSALVRITSKSTVIFKISVKMLKY